MNARVLFGLAALLAIAPSCGKGSDVQAAELSTTESSTLVAYVPPETKTFFEAMVRAPEHTRYGGQRHLWMRYTEDDRPEVLEYDETVWADGNGGFAIDPGPVVQPALPLAQRELFELMQKNREGFLFRYRDFWVRDVSLMLQNYHPTVTGNVITVVGRPCDEVRFDKARSNERHYLVAVDQATRIVLRWEECNVHDQPLARMEFTSFDTNPNLATVTMHTDQASSPLDPMGTNQTELGFALRQPRLVYGFQLQRAERIEAGGRTWARLQYHDGVEPLFYLYSARVPGHVVAVDHGDPIGAAAVIRVMRSGSWVIAQCNRGGAEFIVAGKLDEARLIAMLKSAVE